MMEDFDSDENEENEENEMLNDFDDDESDNLEGDIDINEIIEKSVAHKSENISFLRNSNKYCILLNNVKSYLEKDKNDKLNNKVIDNKSIIDSVLLNETPEYKLITECNNIIQEIDEDINKSYRYVADIYSKKFPELEQIIPNKIDYLKTVDRIRNETDMTLINLNDILTSSTVMVVSVTGSTTNGIKLSDLNINECIRGCNEVFQLINDKNIILEFVESRMIKIAPNLCILIGSRITAQLMVLVGGLINLTRIPSCNVQVVGQEKNKNLAGFSHISAQLHTGILYNCDLVQLCPPYLRKKALKVISSKVALVARFDAYKTNIYDNRHGDQIRKDLELKIKKWQEPAKARIKKALPIPEEKKKNRRGGKRVRKFKARFAQTELSKEQNKMNMTINEGEYGDSVMDAEGLPSSFLNRNIGNNIENGKVRALTTEKKYNLINNNNNNNKNKKFKNNHSNHYNGTNSTIRSFNSNSNNINGMASSFAFTPVQGIELINPNAQIEKVKQANAKWFNSTSGFLSAMPK